MSGEVSGEVGGEVGGGVGWGGRWAVRGGVVGGASVGAGRWEVGHILCGEVEFMNFFKFLLVNIYIYS